jgi:1-acyl-sn-glycerol-3-phosphate acyltransferase
MLILRSLVYNILFYLLLIAIMLVLSPSLLMGPRWVKGAARCWGFSSIWLLKVCCGTHFEVRGRENIPAQGCLVACKHQSFWEVFALTTVFPDFTYVLKRELTWIPLFGWYLGRSDQIAIDRSRGRAALAKITRQARVVLAGGGQLFIFPEGTRRPPGAPPDYKFGVAFLYSDLKVPCVPVALNSGLFWPRRRFLRRPGTIVIDIMPPIPPGVPTSEFLPRLQEAIETASDRLLADALAIDPSLRGTIRQAPAASASRA